MDESVDAYLLHVVVKAVAKLGLGGVFPALAHVNERDALAKRVHAALHVQTLEQVARQAQLGRGEVLELRAVQAVEHGAELGDRLVALAEIAVGAAGVLVHLAGPVTLDALLDEPGRAAVRLQFRECDYGRCRHLTPLSNGDTYFSAGFHMRRVATP